MSSLEGDQRPNSSFRSLRDDHYWSFVLWRHVNVLLWYVSMALQHQWHINWRKSPIISHTSIRELEYIVWQGFMVEKQSIWIECYECLIRWLSNWGASLCIESHDLGCFMYNLTSHNVLWNLWCYMFCHGFHELWRLCTKFNNLFYLCCGERGMRWRLHGTIYRYSYCLTLENIMTMIFLCNLKRRGLTTYNCFFAWFNYNIIHSMSNYCYLSPTYWNLRNLHNPT